MDVDELKEYFSPTDWDKICYAVNAANRRDWLDPVKEAFGLDSPALITIYAHHLNSRVPLPKSLIGKEQAGEMVDKILADD
jgi:hypothetical protein